jgi:hypothetical protein
MTSGMRYGEIMATLGALLRKRRSVGHGVHYVPVPSNPVGRELVATSRKEYFVTPFCLSFQKQGLYAHATDVFPRVLFII